MRGSRLFWGLSLLGALQFAGGCGKSSTRAKPGGSSGSGSSSGGSTATTGEASGSSSTGGSSAGSTGGTGDGGVSTTGSSGSSSSTGGTGNTGSSGTSSGSSGGTTGSSSLDAGQADYCAGHGAPVLVGDSTVDGGTVSTCAGNLAQRTFRFALCTCEALNINHPINFDSFLGLADGGFWTARNNGSVGVDEGLATTANSAHLTLGGSLFVADGGIVFRGSANVAGELHAGSAVDSPVGSTVGADAFCSADVAGSLTITGDLYTPASSAVGSGVSFASRIDAGVVVPPPCDCTNLVDIAGIVASHQANNDNGVIGNELDGGYADGGLAADAWATGTGPTDFTFPCGRYYLSGVQIGATTTWHVDGRTALLIGGDFAINQGFNLDVPPGSELDMFIAGNLSVAAPSTFGTQSSVANTRFYVGGSNTIILSSPTGFYGNIYAPFAQVEVDSPTDIYGAIFSRAFVNGASGGVVRFHYDEDILQAGVECLPAPQPDGGMVDGGMVDGGMVDGGNPATDGGGPVADGGGIDAGTPPDAGSPVDAGPPPPPPPQCTSCLDCNNQACINGQCTSCTDSTQCCAPLVCVSGTCQVLFR